MVERRPVRLRLAMPWIAHVVADAAGAGESTPGTPAADWLVGRGRLGSPVTGTWREWLLETSVGALAALRASHAGPCLRAAATGTRPTGTWACARPAHLITAIDHLQLARESPLLEPGEAGRLLADLNAHFAAEGLRFEAGGATGDWMLHCANAIDCVTVEPDVAAGRNLREAMPGGADGPRVRSLLNEIQMLLHEHEVNAARERAGRPVVNALWLWGFGAIADDAMARDGSSAGVRTSPPLPPLATDDGWLAGLWRMHGTEALALAGRGLDAVLDDLATASRASATGGACLVACARPGLNGRGALDWAEASVFAPLRAGLQRGAFDSIDLLLGTRPLALDRGSRLALWRRPRPIVEALA